MNVELRLSEADDAHVVKNLWPLYQHELSEFDASTPPPPAPSSKTAWLAALGLAERAVRHQQQLPPRRCPRPRRSVSLSREPSDRRPRRESCEREAHPPREARDERTERHLARGDSEHSEPRASPTAGTGANPGEPVAEDPAALVGVSSGVGDIRRATLVALLGTSYQECRSYSNGRESWSEHLTPRSHS